MTYRTIILLALLAGLLSVSMYIIYFVNIVNPRVMEALRTNPESAQAEKVMLLTFPDGKVIPVNYLRQGNKVYAGSDFGWSRAFRDGGARVTVLIQGEEFAGHAVAVENDLEYRDRVFERLRPTVPKWLPEWLKAVLVVIELDNE